MIVEPIQLVQIAVSTDHIFGLDKHGAVWYRRKLPYTTTSTVYHARNKADNEEEEEAKKMWKRLSMNGRIGGDEIPPAKDVPPEIAGTPVNAKPEVEEDEEVVQSGFPFAFGTDGFEE